MTCSYIHIERISVITMSDKVYLVEKRGLGCCSMMLWDALAIVGFSMYFFTQIVGIHVVFAILIGLGASIGLFALMKVPVLGAILQIGMGFAWVAAIYYLVETHMSNMARVDGELTEMGFMSALFIYDPIWYWTALILASIIFVGLHIISVRDYHGDEKADRAFSNPLKKGRYSSDSTNEELEGDVVYDSFEEFDDTMTDENNDNDMNNKNDEQETAAMLFHGCDTLDKLNKRYKNLAKTYHPDTEAGDSDMMKIINNEYERLKSELEEQ